MSHNWVLNSNNYHYFNYLLSICSDFLKDKSTDLNEPFSGVTVKEMANRFKSVDLNSAPLNADDFLSELKHLYLNDAVYFNSPNYMAHLMCPVAYPAVVAELTMAAINTSMDTWDQSAGGTLIEQKIIDWVCNRVGFEKTANQVPDGVFTSGGTQSNFMALLLARDNYCLNHLNGHSVQMDGMPSNWRKFRILASEVSHFSVQKAAAKMGLGYNSVIPVKVGETFEIDAIDFEQKIKECVDNDLIVIAAVATVGTTDYGSIDPLNEMARMCRKYNIWLHADAAYGGGLILSNKYRNLINGIENADSITLDFHKSFLQPASSSALIVKNFKTLSCVTHHADYLNPLSEQKAGTPNLVTKSLQTTRRFDALKLWFTLRIMGWEEVGRIFDDVIDLSMTVYNKHVDDPCLEFLHKPNMSTLVFRFVSPNLSAEQHNDINYFIQKAVLGSGKSIIASTKYKGVFYLKFTFLNPNTQLEDVDNVIELIKEFSKQWEVKNQCA